MNMNAIPLNDCDFIQWTQNDTLIWDTYKLTSFQGSGRMIKAIYFTYAKIGINDERGCSCQKMASFGTC